MIDLTIRLREDPESPERVFRLVAGGGGIQPATTVTDPGAALAAVEKYGEDIFFPRPGPPKLCTQQYGGPQVAVVTGTFHGRTVESVFTRTDGCEISRWKAMAPLLGSAGGAFGAT
ncbi:serine protease inhibitor [Pseudarthrobacter sp. NamB4]|uniref:serine protease inhibitor n=1 Tax=Pseudarthrobacter sp. NamB4 TaxID=2576837 RepID=UPI0010FDAD84|nr:serine protease inhibitor [Pseudarthrobacter sp. NamB4]TLM75168.1 serine protease inhibitor [Pseudarthrobacter sp. NamB4]